MERSRSFLTLQTEDPILNDRTSKKKMDGTFLRGFKKKERENQKKGRATSSTLTLEVTGGVTKAPGLTERAIKRKNKTGTCAFSQPSYGREAIAVRKEKWRRGHHFINLRKKRAKTKEGSWRPKGTMESHTTGKDAYAGSEKKNEAEWKKDCASFPSLGGKKGKRPTRLRRGE